MKNQEICLTQGAKESHNNLKTIKDNTAVLSNCRVPGTRFFSAKQSGRIS